MYGLANLGSARFVGTYILVITVVKKSNLEAGTGGTVPHAHQIL